MFGSQEWSPQTVTAFIAAIAALTIAIFQSITNRRTSRTIEKLKAQLELQKQFQSEYLRKYLESLIEGKGQELQAFREFLQHVQAFRDKLRRVMLYPDSYEKKLLQKEIDELSDIVLDTFAKNQIYLTEQDCHHAHELKNKCKFLSVEIGHYLNTLKKGETISFSSDIKNLLNEVADIQGALRKRAFVVAKTFTESLKVKIEENEEDGRI